jgi:hypothetical protein
MVNIAKTHLSMIGIAQPALDIDPPGSKIKHAPDVPRTGSASGHERAWAGIRTSRRATHFGYTAHLPASSQADSAGSIPVTRSKK